MAASELGGAMAAVFPREVDFSDEAIEDPGEVADLAADVDSVNLAFNLLPSIAPAVAALEALVYLNLAHNDIDDLEPLRGASQLRVLRASHNRVRSLAPLARCAALEEVWVDHNEIAHIAEIDALKGLESLSRLLMHANPCVKVMPPEKTRTILVVELPQLQQLSVSDDVFGVTESARSVAVRTSRTNEYLVLIRQLRAESQSAGGAAEAPVPKAPRPRGAVRGVSPPLPTPSDSSPQDGSVVGFPTGGPASSGSLARAGAKGAAASSSGTLPRRPKGRSPSPAARRAPRSKAAVAEVAKDATLASAVQGLPSFAAESKASQRAKATSKAGKRGGPRGRGGSGSGDGGGASGGAGSSSAGPPVPFVVSKPPPKETWALPYAGGAPGVAVMDDGGAKLKWPNGALGVSVDAEAVRSGEAATDGAPPPVTLRYRMMASARENGRAVVHFDGTGGGDVSTAAGTTLMSVTADGSGFQCDSKGELLRRWDTEGRIVYSNAAALSRLAKKAGSEDAVAVVGDLASPIEARVSKDLGVQYSPATRELRVYVDYNGLKHCFVRGENVGGTNVPEGTNLFGRMKRTKSSAASVASSATDALDLDDTPSATHSDRLSAIRAAVGGL
mmetsp:Transcript_19972/g.70664  ORF Transcript_19972/g.70664 Transcript_19972/m.70664 type:complete len:617 (-) Transcript_19972:19-1869(-)